MTNPSGHTLDGTTADSNNAQAPCRIASLCEARNGTSERSAHGTWSRGGMASPFCFLEFVVLRSGEWASDPCGVGAFLRLLNVLSKAALLTNSFLRIAIADNSQKRVTPHHARCDHMSLVMCVLQLKNVNRRSSKHQTHRVISKAKCRPTSTTRTRLNLVFNRGHQSQGCHHEIRRPTCGSRLYSRLGRGGGVGGGSG